MTHKELWLEIAKVFSVPRKERDYWSNEGHCICWLLDDIAPWSLRREDFYLGFNQDRSIAKRVASSYWWPTNEKGDTQRCLFACFMAAMSEEDYNEMVEAV